MPTTTTIRPIDRAVDALLVDPPSESQSWVSAHCPAHDDRSKSLSIRETEDGGVILKCHAGCSRAAILEAAHLQERDLHTSGGYRPPFRPRPKLELVDLAADKLLPWKFLFSLGLADEYDWNGTKGVQIPYYLESGEEHTKERVRIALSGKKGSFWNEHTPGEMIPYGLHKLSMGREQRYLLIGEGESDAWTCWFHDVPYLGIPGAKNTACLHSGYLSDIPKVYIIQEPDAAGKRFYKDVHKQLRATGYKGEIFQLEFKKLTGHKDPNELHQHLYKEGKYKEFKSTLLGYLKNAVTSGDEIDRTRPPKPKPQTFRLCDLQQEEFAPLKWAIPDLLPEGLSWLCGKPKLGKSWMLLQMMLAIAAGGVTLGNVPVEEGEVLYLSLEDNKRRLKSRTDTVLQKLNASPNFQYAIEWPRLNEGGLEALEDWILEHPRVRLIGIDTWARFKPKMQGGSNKQQYDEDYDSLSPLQQLAGKYSISIVIVHHMRKQESEDPLDGIAGSVALQGAVDGFLLLYRKRGEDDARLYINGRDIEQSQELMLSFEAETATWKIKGDADSSDIASTPERQAILDALKPYPEGLALKQIASILNKNVNTTRNLIVSLRNEKKIALKNNIYSLVTPSKSSKDSNHSKPSKGVENGQEGQPGYYGSYYADEPGYYDNVTPLVTPINPMKSPVKPIGEMERAEVTMVTMDTSENAPQIDIPTLINQVLDSIKVNQWIYSPQGECGQVKRINRAAQVVEMEYYGRTIRIEGNNVLAIKKG